MEVFGCFRISYRIVSETGNSAIDVEKTREGVKVAVHETASSETNFEGALNGWSLLNDHGDTILLLFLSKEVHIDRSPRMLEKSEASIM